VDAPRLHHQWLPDVVFVERFALSPDTKERLAELGYSMSEQTPWGAAAVIAVGGEAPNRRAESTSGNDSTATAGMRRGLIYGASDPRRPAGAAIGYDGNRANQ
jgi:gamma-glutamyltranspeptidase/glutathione hydrolase